MPAYFTGQPQTMKDRSQLISDILKMEEKVNNLILVHKADNWLDLNLTIDQLKSLVLIQHRNRISFRELADALGITRSNITGIADRLVQNGLVTRNPNLNGDRRIQYLLLTEKGTGVLKKIRQQMVDSTIAILEGLGSDDLEALKKGLSALITSAENYIFSQQNKGTRSDQGKIL